MKKTLFVSYDLVPYQSLEVCEEQNYCDNKNGKENRL